MYSLFFCTINMFCTAGELHCYNLTVWCHLNAQYCRLYFSESLTCGFKMCRFQHLPMEGDEKVHSVVFTLFIYLFFLDFTKDSKLFVYCVHFMFLILNLKKSNWIVGDCRANITLCCDIAVIAHFLFHLLVLYWKRDKIHQKSNVPSESRWVSFLSFPLLFFSHSLCARCMLNWLPIFAASSVSFLLSCSTPVLLRSCVYRILPEKPTRSVFLFADIFLPPLGSAESWHVVRGLLRPQCWLGSQHSGQCSSPDINHGEN